MIDTKKILTWGIPGLAAAVVLGMLLFHAAPSDAPSPERMKRDVAPAVVSRAPEVLRTAAPPPPPPKPAPEKVIAQATDEARVRSTYQNFRTAVATGNQILQDTLRPIVLRDRDVALRLAKRDLDEAPSDIDRDIAQRTLDALR